MKYKPINKTPAEILTTLGFKSANRGYTLDRIRPHPDNLVRIHCLIEVDGTMVTHEDYLREGKHESSKVSHPGTRLDRFRELYEAVDNGKTPILGQKLRKNYAFARELKKKHKVSMIIY